MIEKPKGVFQIQLMTTDNKKSNNIQLKDAVTSQVVQDTYIQKKQIEKNQHQRVKSKTRKIFIGLIISLSALMFGYSLKEITSVPIDTLVKEFGITISSSSAQSILIGILPLGSVLGAILTKLLIKKFKRLSGIYIFSVVNCGAIVLINITNFTSLIIGRFLQGICIGYYSAIAPIYLREIAPKQLRRLLGLFFSLGKIIGVLVVIALELILQAANVSFGWRIILSLTGFFSLLQAVLIFFFGSDTPTEMIEKGKPEQAMHIIKKFYVQKYVEQVFNEYTQQYEAEIGKGKETMSQNLNEEKGKKKDYKFKFDLKQPRNEDKYLAPQNNKTLLKLNEGDKMSQQQYRSQIVYKIQDQPDQKQVAPSQQNLQQKHKATTNFNQKKQMAYSLGVHLCLIRHWIGGNAIITQGGLFIKTFNPGLGHYTSLIINLVQFLFVLIGLIYLQKLMGKKPLFLLSIALLSFINLGLTVGMIFEQILTCMFLMCLYMVVYGAAFISPIWAYPSEIIPASDSLVPNIVHWIALALSTLIPPLITGVMPDKNPYPVFLFFGLYGFIGFIHVKFKLRQSDGFTYNQIISSFK